MSIILQKVLPRIMPENPKEFHIISERVLHNAAYAKWLHFGITCHCLKIIYIVFHSGRLYYLKNKEDVLHILQEVPYSFDKGALDKRTTICTKEPHLEIWNDGLMFQGILHLVQRDDAFSWRDIFQIVKTSSLPRMQWSLEQITDVNLNIYIYIMKLNLKWYWNLSVECSMLSMQSCMCWRSFTKYYRILFKQQLQYFKGNAQSQAALSLCVLYLKKKNDLDS